MSKYSIEKETLDAIADAILAQTGGTAALSPTDMPDAIAAISGESESLLKNLTEVSITTARLDQMTVIVPENVKKFAISNTVTDLTVIKRSGVPITSMRECFKGLNFNKVIRLNFDTSNVTDWYGAFNSQGSGNGYSTLTIYGTLDFSSATTVEGLISTDSWNVNNTTTKRVAFTVASESLGLSLYLGLPVTDETLQSVLDGLAVVEDAKTLTVQSLNGEDLTEEQIAAATAKNWTIAY